MESLVHSAPFENYEGAAPAEGGSPREGVVLKPRKAVVNRKRTRASVDDQDDSEDFVLPARDLESMTYAGECAGDDTEDEKEPPQLCQFEEGCNKNAIKGDYFCRKHGGKRVTVGRMLCKHASGCTKKAKMFGLCKAHGGAADCKVEGCTRKARLQGFCRQHGGGGEDCLFEGCPKKAQDKGLCKLHGGQKMCKEEGCDKKARLMGRCKIHGGIRLCSFEGCEKQAIKAGLCKEHGKLTNGTKVDVDVGGEVVGVVGVVGIPAPETVLSDMDAEAVHHHLEVGALETSALDSGSSEVGRGVLEMHGATMMEPDSEPECSNAEV